MALILLILGAGVIIGTLLSRAKALESISWPCADGIVRECEKRDGGEGDYQLSIKYEYIVEGVSYKGKRLTYSILTGAKTDLIALVKKYPIGSVVKVYYNPEKPADAVLITKAGNNWVFALLFGLTITSAGFFLYVYN